MKILIPAGFGEEEEDTQKKARRIGCLLYTSHVGEMLQGSIDHFFGEDEGLPGV